MANQKQQNKQNLNVPEKKNNKNFLQKMLPKKPISLFSSASNETFKFEDIDFSKKNNKKLLYTMFRRYPLVYRALILRSVLAVPDIKFHANTDEGKNLIRNFLKNIHPASGKNKLVQYLRRLSIDTDIFGTGFWDPVENQKKTNFVAIKPIHPLDMDLIRTQSGKVKRDNYGNPVGWKQETSGFWNKSQKLDFDRVAYFTYTTVGDEELGIPLCETIYKTVFRLMNIEEGLATAIFRHGFPLYDVTVGTNDKPPTKTQIDNAAQEVAGLNYKSEFVHPPNYNVKLMESYSLGKGNEYTKDFIRGIASASGLPEWALTSSAENLSRASAEALMKESKPTAKDLQLNLKLFLEEQILAKLAKKQGVEEVPRVEFMQVPLLDPEVEATTKKYIEKNMYVGLDDDTDEFGIVEAQNKMRNAQEPGGTTTSSPEMTGTQKTQGNKPEKRRKLPGIYLVNNHAKMIADGEKKSILKSNHAKKMLDEYIGKDMYLVSDDKVYGIIRLRKPREININEVIQLEYAHKVTEEEREKWWPKEDELWIYEFEEIEIFNKPKKYPVEQGVQVLVKQVNPEKFSNGK